MKAARCRCSAAFPSAASATPPGTSVTYVVNVGDLDQAFDDGDTVDQESLRKAGLAKGPADGVRILGQGDLTKRLVVRAHHFSKSAAEKIKAKGGTAEVIPPPKKPVRNKMKPRAKAQVTDSSGRLRSAAGSARMLRTKPVWILRCHPVKPGQFMHKLITIFKIPELRQKILITALFLVIYRIGFHVPLPMIDQARMAQRHARHAQEALGQVLGFVSMFSGGTLSQSCIFGLGIMPYISASIIFQLLASVYPPLEKLQKEGESGRKKINEYTRYATVVICLIQAYFWVQHIMRPTECQEARIWPCPASTASGTASAPSSP